MAEPDTVVISAATHRLVQGLFECQDLGPQTLKGISTPLSVYRVIGESEAQSRFEVAVSTGLTPLVGREEELGLLQRRWAQAKEGAGQVVLLSGEAGIGKSRLVQTLKEQVAGRGSDPHRVSLLALSSEQCLLSHHRPPAAAACSLQREDTPQAKLEQTPADAQRTIASPRPIPCRCWRPCSRCRTPKVLRPLP